MEHWTCTKCGCDYHYLDPEVIGGNKYCQMCADGTPDTPKTVALGPVFWAVLIFILGFLAGVMVTAK